MATTIQSTFICAGCGEQVTDHVTGEEWAELQESEKDSNLASICEQCVVVLMFASEDQPIPPELMDHSYRMRENYDRRRAGQDQN